MRHALTKIVPPNSVRAVQGSRSFGTGKDRDGLASPMLEHLGHHFPRKPRLNAFSTPFCTRLMWQANARGTHKRCFLAEYLVNHDLQLTEEMGEDLNLSVPRIADKFDGINSSQRCPTWVLLCLSIYALEGRGDSDACRLFRAERRFGSQKAEAALTRQQHQMA